MATAHHTIQQQLLLPLRGLEVWRPIAGWEGYYEVSNFGRVRSLDRELVCFRDGQQVTMKIKGTVHRGQLCGRRRCYRQVKLRKKNKQYPKLVHHLVLLAFVGPRPTGAECNHRDGNPFNNAATNLAWVTPEQNKEHAYTMGKLSRSPGRPRKP